MPFALFALALFPACGEGDTPRDPPLRPLLYTEPVETPEPIEGYGEWYPGAGDPLEFPASVSTSHLATEEEASGPGSTAQHSLNALVASLISGDEDDLAAWTPGAADLNEVLQIPPTAAEGLRVDIAASLQEMRQHLNPGVDTTRRRPDWGTLQQPTQTRLGVPRNVDGRVVSESEAVMHDTNGVDMHIVGSDVDYAINVPRLFRGTDGLWYPGRPLRLQGPMRALTTLGVDGKPELMEVEHAPLPVRAGNFWDYRSEELVGDEWREVRGEGFRDTIVDVTSFGLARLVTLERRWQGTSRPVETWMLLQTPGAVFRCSSQCARNADSLAGILREVGDDTPLLSGPMRRGTRARGATDSDETVVVPAGEFRGTTNVTSRDLPLYREADFLPGVGFLAFNNPDSTPPRRAALRSYRILR